MSYNLIAQTSEDTFGKLDAPPGVDKFQAASGADIGIFFFISRLLQIGTVVVGIWVLINIMLAGYVWISNVGDSKSTERVREILTQSAVGVLILFFSYTFAGLLGLLLFGDASYLLNPVIEGPSP